MPASELSQPHSRRAYRTAIVPSAVLMSFAGGKLRVRAQQLLINRCARNGGQRRAKRQRNSRAHRIIYARSLYYAFSVVGSNVGERERESFGGSNEFALVLVG